MSLCAKRVDFDQVWAHLSVDIQRMFNGDDDGGTGSANDSAAASTKKSSVSAMALYNDVYDLCVARPVNHWEALLLALTRLLLEHTSAIAKNLIAPAHSDTNLMHAYATSWTRYRHAVQWLDQVCRYLNMELAATRPSKATQFAIQDQLLPGLVMSRRLRVEGLAFEVWRQQVLEHIQHAHNDRLLTAILSLIHRDRIGKLALSTDVRTAVQSLVVLGQYSYDAPLQLFIDRFEVPYVRAAVEFYKRTGEQLMEEAGVVEYMAQSVTYLSEEEVRCRSFCDSSSAERIVQHCADLLVAPHRERLQHEFDVMMAADRVADMSNAYKLLARVRDGLLPVIRQFEMHISRSTKAAVVLQKTAITEVAARAIGQCLNVTNLIQNWLRHHDIKDPSQYVLLLTEVYRKYVSWVQDVFCGEVAFQAAVDKAFRAILNDSIDRQMNISEILAKYCDTLLRRSGGKSATMSDVDIDESIDATVSLFKYVDDKDVFQKFYARLLAKRLIYGTSHARETEELAITKLKDSCGVEYTSKFVRMFTDIAVSDDINVEYKRSLPMKAPFDFGVLVLAAGTWPLEQKSNPAGDFILPPSLVAPVTSYTSFYTAKHSGRRLEWLHHLSRADIRMHGWDKRYELTVSGYQLAVLLHFNDRDCETVRGISAAVNLAVGDVVKLLKPFVKLQVITASSEMLDEETLISLNKAFSSKRIKIKVNTQMQADTPAQEIATRQSVDEDRKLFLQATIVRIMKSRKKLRRVELIDDVLHMCNTRFTPPIPLINDCIKALVSKDYMEHDMQTDELVYT